MLNDNDNKDLNPENQNAPVSQAATDGDADRNSDGSAMTTEQKSFVKTAESIFADILKDAEDDLYGRDGNTNDSELAGQRLQAMAGRLVGAFSQAANGLSLVIEAARQKIENTQKSDALIDLQDQREKKKQEDAEKTNDGFDDAIDRVEKQRKLEREREEWSRSTHSYAGIEMTGEEWGEFADKLKGDTPLRKRLLEKLKKEGKPEDRANELVNQMALLAKMQSLPPNQWTPEMQALDAKLKANPKLEQELHDNMREAKTMDSTLQSDGPDVQQNVGISKAATDTSTANRDETLSQSLGAKVSLPPAKPDQSSAGSGDPQFPTAPDLGEHHRAAMEAKEPLDVPKKTSAFVPKPAPSAPGAGFDV